MSAVKRKKFVFIVSMLFFFFASFHAVVFGSAPVYLTPRVKLSKTSLVWRSNPVGILGFNGNYNKSIIVRELPDKNSKRLLSCLKIADCGFDFVAAGGYLDYLYDTEPPSNFFIPEREQLASEISVELVATEKKGNWYKIVYHTTWGKEGWVYFGNVDGAVHDRNRIYFTPIENFFKNALAVYFLDDPERNEHFLQIKGSPDDNSVTVTKVTTKDNLVLIGKPKLQGDWAKVQVQRYNECEQTLAENAIYGVDKESKKETECPWGWVRWRTPEGLLLMWTYWWDTC